jgi:serine acetyltransferase
MRQLLKVLICDSTRYGGRNFIRVWFRDPRFKACFILRLGCFLNQFALFKYLGLYRLLKNRLNLKYGIDTGFEVSIGPGLKLVHLGGVVIHKDTIIGSNLTILNNTTIGQKDSNIKVPILGDDVYMGVFSAVLGDIHVGSNVVVGSHTLVLSDVPSGSKVVGIPGRILE